MEKNIILHKNIMRRVFYAFGLRLVLSPLALYGVMFLSGLLLLAKTVHVAKVWETFINQPVGKVPEFMITTLSHGEVLTLLSLVFITISTFMICRALWSARFVFSHRQQWL